MLIRKASRVFDTRRLAQLIERRRERYEIASDLQAARELRFSTKTRNHARRLLQKFDAGSVVTDSTRSGESSTSHHSIRCNALVSLAVSFRACLREYF